MHYPAYHPSWFLHNGFLMTLYVGLRISPNWKNYVVDAEPPYQQHIFTGAQRVPLFGLFAIPPKPRGTIVATYGVTGRLENQYSLQIFARKAYASSYAVVIFDWRAHGKSMELSPTLTSDGLYEGEDFVRIAQQAAALGCPSKFWFVGFSLGGQLALWGGSLAPEILGEDMSSIKDSDIGGVAVVCPCLDSNRSLNYLMKHRTGRYIEKGIAMRLKELAMELHDLHPGAIDEEAIRRIDSIWAFDNELVIEKLGFPSVEAYYDATSGLSVLPHLRKPTLIIYAEDDPFFDPGIVSDLKIACARNPVIDLLLTRHGGHVFYFNSKKGQEQAKDPDRWWAWNRVLQWIGANQ
ncbi:alpha/beta hydrolase fold protein [Calothrix sp. NIES-4071]|nr:alpha/beta hydrolase fold protein [Calothrix sp. NIES-4071]BAZ56863.1 alpha/beta hydrolase fold protein [Calothrix sp. NIES-4105]